jgi:rhamnosyl/mannosyltransferase
VFYAPVSPKFPQALAHMLKKLKPDILHFHMPNTSALWALALPAAARIPWIIHWHADVVCSRFDWRLRYAYFLYRPLEARMLSRAKRIIATSHQYLASSRALTPWKKKCRVAPLGINPARLKDGWQLGGSQLSRSGRSAAQPDCRLTRKWQSDKRYKVLAVGRLSYYKGHEVLIRAAKHLPKVNILIVGSGDRYRCLKQLIEYTGVQSKITLGGPVSNSVLHRLFTHADCVCLPSIERTEAFSLVLLEAMSYAKPVVASNIAGSGISTVIVHGQTGLLTPPGDSVKLAQALKIVSENIHLGQKMGQAGQKRFETLFQIQPIAAQIARMYHRIINQPAI